MSNETKMDNQEKAHLLPIKTILRMLGWVIFSIIVINVIVKLCELYVNINGINAFFYLLIFLLSLSSIFFIYPKLNRMFQQDQRRDMERYLKEGIVIGYLENGDDEFKYDSLDLNKILKKKNLKNDKQVEKEDKKTWLDEERKLFKV